MPDGYYALRVLIIGFDRRRAESCADCNAACDNVCPMRIKRHMFTCTQCNQCANACSQVRAGNPQGTLLKWVQQECALDKSARDFGHHIDIPDHCFGGGTDRVKGKSPES